MGGIDSVFENDDTVMMQESNSFGNEFFCCNATIPDSLGDVDYMYFLIVKLDIGCNTFRGNFGASTLEALSGHFEDGLDMKFVEVEMRLE